MLLALAFATTSCDDDDDDFKIYTAKIITTIESTGISVTSTGATITSTIKDLSTQSTTAYAVGVAYGTSDDSSSATKVTGSLGDDGETVTTELTGLTPDVTYTIGHTSLSKVIQPTTAKALRSSPQMVP